MVNSEPNLPVFNRLVHGRDIIYAEMFFTKSGFGGAGYEHWDLQECLFKKKQYKENNFSVIEIDRAIEAINNFKKYLSEQKEINPSWIKQLWNRIF